MRLYPNCFNNLNQRSLIILYSCWRKRGLEYSGKKKPPAQRPGVREKLSKLRTLHQTEYMPTQFARITRSLSADWMNSWLSCERIQNNPRKC